MRTNKQEVIHDFVQFDIERNKGLFVSNSMIIVLLSLFSPSLSNAQVPYAK